MPSTNRKGWVINEILLKPRYNGWEESKETRTEPVQVFRCLPIESGDGGRHNFGVMRRLSKSVERVEMHGLWRLASERNALVKNTAYTLAESVGRIQYLIGQRAPIMTRCGYGCWTWCRHIVISYHAWSKISFEQGFALVFEWVGPIPGLIATRNYWKRSANKQFR